MYTKLWVHSMGSRHPRDVEQIREIRRVEEDG